MTSANGPSGQHATEEHPKSSLFPQPADSSTFPPTDDRQPLLGPSFSSLSDGPLPASHGAEGTPPPPSSWLSSASTSFSSFVRRFEAPVLLSNARSSFSSLASHLPQSTSHHMHSAIAAAYSAVHARDTDSESSVSGLYLTPLADCCSLDRLAFAPAPYPVFPPAATSASNSISHRGLASWAQLSPGQKTLALGTFLLILGSLIILFPSLPTSALILLAGSCFLVAGVLSALSCILTLASPNTSAYAFLLLALFQLSASLFLLLYPQDAEVFICLLLSIWLIVKGVGRVTAWRSLSSEEGVTLWRSPMRSGVSFILLGALLFLCSHPVPNLLGIIFGWDIFLSGLLLSAAGLYSWRAPGQGSGAQDSDPLVQAQSEPAPSYTV